MNRSIPYLAAVGSLALALTGCVGVGPNTQQGAVTGGTLGAIAGAVIGHNSAGGDALGGAILGATAGAIAGGTLGNAADNQQGTLYGRYERPYRSRVGAHNEPPPMPSLPTVAEAVPASPAPEAVWIPGYWNYDARAYIWVAGHWEVPPSNTRAYITAHWERRQGGYFWIPSYWY